MAEDKQDKQKEQGKKLMAWGGAIAGTGCLVSIIAIIVLIILLIFIL